ncbi:hypothetical protein J6590_081731 [Homalodisca vitripennis]|nr:hypothetical protein J6590_081731 [Homalodisca vitripennis]
MQIQEWIVLDIRLMMCGRFPDHESPGVNSLRPDSEWEEDAKLAAVSHADPRVDSPGYPPNDVWEVPGP